MPGSLRTGTRSCGLQARMTTLADSTANTFLPQRMFKTIPEDGFRGTRSLSRRCTDEDRVTHAMNRVGVSKGSSAEEVGRSSVSDRD